MTAQAVLQVLIYLVVVLACVKPLGWYMAQVYQGKPCGLNSVKCLGKIENGIYRFCGIDVTAEMQWKSYLITMLMFNFLGFVFLYFVQRLQVFLPLNPQSFAAVDPSLAFNTASSFVTNTNWQAYSGEASLSYFTQMLGLSVQNFFSAATSMALLMALIRGIIRHETSALGNYWVDMVRSILYILLPLSLLLSIFLVSQGVIQNFKPYEKVSVLQNEIYLVPKVDNSGKVIKDAKNIPVVEKMKVSIESIPMGPVASQEAIKLLGSNGGGFFNANSAHPYENPTPLSNFLEMLAILLIPAALCYTYGVMIGDRRQSWAIFIVMSGVLVPLIFACVAIEQHGNPALNQLGVTQNYLANLSPGGNMEGKETRFGIVDSAIWTVATAATGNGSVNSMLDSYLPLGGLIPLWLMQLGEVIFGGVGTGLYGMLMLVIITVFIAGLMVGRTPEYLGKKIEPYEMKMASFAILIMPILVLVLTAFAVSTYMGTDPILNSGPHGFTEVLYAITSMGNNNGSAFAGLNTNTVFYNFLGGLEMLATRFWVAIATLAVAGSLVRKKIIPSSSGTLLTDTPLFMVLLVSVLLVLGALEFLPALALGPIIEHILLWRHYGS